MSRKRIEIPIEVWPIELLNRAKMYNNYLTHWLDNLSIDELEDDEFKQKNKRVVECILQLPEDEKYFIILYYLHYDKHLNEIFNDLSKKLKLNFNSLANRISQIKKQIKCYVEDFN